MWRARNTRRREGHVAGGGSPVTSRGQRGRLDARATPTTPSTTVRVKSMSATKPLPRMRYHTKRGVSGGDQHVDRSPSSVSAGWSWRASRRPAGDPDQRRRPHATSRAVQPRVRQPCGRRRRRGSPRRWTRMLASKAAACRHGDRVPAWSGPARQSTGSIRWWRSSPPRRQRRAAAELGFAGQMASWPVVAATALVRSTACRDSVRHAFAPPVPAPGMWSRGRSLR